ncbi:MAG: DUF350 domain-containing protein [Methanoregula sp.]|jgi:uncharacterized membrane protein YjfL (UPF0719 family)
MILANMAVGLVQLVIAIVFAVMALYIGFALLNKMAPTIDAEKELSQGNIAVAIVVSAVVVASAVVVEFGVTGIAMEIYKALETGIFTGDGFLIVGVAVVQLVFGVILAVGAIYLALKVLEKLASDVELFEELRKGNIAVALEMAGVIIAVAVIISLVYWALRRYWGNHFLLNRIFPHEWQHRVWYIQPEMLHNGRKTAKENRASFYSDSGSASLIFIGYT